MSEEDVKRLHEAMREVDRAVMLAFNPFGPWAPVMIGVTWAIAIPFFIFTATR